MAGYVTKIINKLLRIQDKFYPEAKDYIADGKGKVSQLKIVGFDGETLLLKVNGTRITYADPSDKPTEIFKCTTDTFLDIVSGDISLREAITRGNFSIENASTHHIDLIESEKWAKAFSNLHSVVSQHLKG